MQRRSKSKKKNNQSFQETCLANIQGNHHGIHHRLRLFPKEVLSTGQKLHGKHKDMCELGDKGSVASVTRYKRPRADSSHGASSMLFHHSPCQNLHWRNFTQAVRHLAWATNQRKQQNTKEWRSQFLGNRESYRNLEHISVNTISTLVNSCTVGTAKTFFQHLLTLIKLPQYLLELWKNNFIAEGSWLSPMKPQCVLPMNNSKLTWSHNVSFWNKNSRTVSKCATSMSCCAFNSAALLKPQNTPEMASKRSNALSCAVANPFKL